MRTEPLISSRYKEQTLSPQENPGLQCQKECRRFPRAALVPIGPSHSVSSPSPSLAPAPSSLEAPTRLSSHAGDEPFLLSFFPQVLLKYLLYPERMNVLLMTIERMTAPSLHSTDLAAHMIDVLAAEACFPPQQVATCYCHSSSPRGSAPSLALAPRLTDRQQRGWQQGPAPVPSHSHLCPPPGVKDHEDHLQQPAFHQRQGSSQKPGQGPARADQQIPKGDG